MKRTKPSDWWTVLIVLSSIAGAYFLKSALEINVSAWIAGIGLFLLLTIIWAIVYSQWERRRLGRYLNSLPPGQRLAAMDDYYGGTLSRAMQTPEFRNRLSEEEGRLKKRLGPILKKLESDVAGPPSLDAEGRVETVLKELQDELGRKDRPDAS